VGSSTLDSIPPSAPQSPPSSEVRSQGHEDVLGGLTEEEDEEGPTVSAPSGGAPRAAPRSGRGTYKIVLLTGFESFNSSLYRKVRP
jgi:hypothetical protein